MQTIGVILVIAGLAIGYKSVAAVLANPVKSLPLAEGKRDLIRIRLSPRTTTLLPVYFLAI